MSGHQPLYDLALAYDIAFDFRDLKAECEALKSICLRHGSSSPGSFLDIACGPGYHCIEFAKQGVRSTGLDLNSAMLTYATSKSADFGAEVGFVRGDMREFSIEHHADLAFCGMSSIHHLLTNQDIVTHLRCVARNLATHGLYVIEASHPRDAFGVGQSLKHEWTTTRGEVTVRIRWGKSDDPFDPLAQVRQTSVSIEVESPAGTVKHEFTTPIREITHQELQLIIEASGVFEAVSWLGVLDPDVPLTNDKSSYRMVAVLRKL